MFATSKWRIFCLHMFLSVNLSGWSAYAFDSMIHLNIEGAALGAGREGRMLTQESKLRRRTLDTAASSYGGGGGNDNERLFLYGALFMSGAGLLYLSSQKSLARGYSQCNNGCQELMDLQQTLQAANPAADPALIAVFTGYNVDCCQTHPWKKK